MPSSSLLKSVSLRLPSRTFGLGFIHQHPSNDAKLAENVKDKKIFFGPYFMYGKASVNDGGTIEAYFSQKISSRGQFSLSSLFDNYFEPSPTSKVNSNSQSRTHFQWDFGKFALASSYCTFGKIFGLQFLLNSVPGISSASEIAVNKLNLGGELYYTAQESSGGISLGFRFSRLLKGAEEPMICTLTGNPLMGHYRTTFTTPFISPNVFISTRYDVNINSFDSELSVGAAYLDPTPLNQNVRCAVGLKTGVTFLIRTNITENIKIRFGLKTGPFYQHQVLARPIGSFGLDVAVCM
jgi:hypothetical protein